MGRRANYEAVITQLECPECGGVFPIARRRRSQRKSGHIKDLWCAHCKKITKHIEKKEWEFSPTWSDENSHKS